MPQKALRTDGFHGGFQVLNRLKRLTHVLTSLVEAHREGHTQQEARMLQSLRKRSSLSLLHVPHIDRVKRDNWFWAVTLPDWVRRAHDLTVAKELEVHQSRLAAW
eukprot:6473163-Amphidinium_carterae.1